VVAVTKKLDHATQQESEKVYINAILPL